MLSCRAMRVFGLVAGIFVLAFACSDRSAQIDHQAEWREVLTEAFTKAAKDYGLDQRRFPVTAMVSLVMTFNVGMMLERMEGVTAGHDQLLGGIDKWLQELERTKKGGKG